MEPDPLQLNPGSELGYSLPCHVTFAKCPLPSMPQFPQASVRDTNNTHLNSNSVLEQYLAQRKAYHAIKEY